MSKVNILFLLSLGLLMSGAAKAAELTDEVIAQSISSDACDDRLVDDDEQTAENRAVDKASLSAVKLSGIIQRYKPDLSASATDTIAYRIIDEYLVNVAHAVKFSDSNRVCVKLMADVEMTTADLDRLVEEYQNSDAPAEQIATVVQKVNENTMVKPGSLTEKKLLHVKKMVFWNGNETDHYKDLLTGLFSNSEYFYVTDDESIADFIVIPHLNEAVVDEIDRNNHKMQISVELEVISPNDKDFSIQSEKQKLPMLFKSDKDEQRIADDLVRKLLTKTAAEMSRKIDKYSADKLQKSKLN